MSTTDPTTAGVHRAPPHEPRTDLDVPDELDVLDDVDVPQTHLLDLHARLVDDARQAGLLEVAYRTLDSPLGSLLVAATPVGVVRLAFATQGHTQVLADLAATISPRVLHAPATFDTVARELEEYFAGRRRTFDVPLDLRLTHGFRREVVQHLPQVPYGRTASYAAMAAVVGRARAVRAVGTACALNPLPVLLPCHRVVRSDGTPGRYVGGDHAKRALLQLESAHALD